MGVPEPQTHDPYEAPDDGLDQAQMPFLEHLRELRKRVRNSVIAVLVAVVGTYQFADYILLALYRPLALAWVEKMETPPPRPGIFAPAEGFWAYLSISLWAGIFVASPIIFYQLWKFVAPGLYKRERRFGVLFAVASAVCFIGGGAFCYFVVLEPIYSFLLGYSMNDLSDIAKRMNIPVNDTSFYLSAEALRIGEFVKFGRKLILGFGLVFELPIFIFVLSLMGVVTHRSLWKFNRWWIVLSFIISAALTPPDPASQILMAAPLIILYNFSIGIAWIVTRRREAAQAAFR